MCGIVAVLCTAETAGDIDESTLAPALRALAHRGPDDTGRWIAPDRRIGLGHNRLAVRDVAGGAQPVSSADGRIVAVVNGELYDTAALEKDLRGYGHRFRTRCDSELVVHAWAQWGPAMLERLHGEFAFVLRDERTQVLFAARDRFGVKPLVWARHAGRLLLASRVRGLLALGLSPAWDHATLLRSAALQYPSPAATLFAGAHALPAGHWMMVRDNRIRIEEYWDLDYPRTPRPYTDPAEAVEEFTHRFDAAVTARLAADVPVAYQLSGGLDSSAVLATAARSSAQVEAFTLSFADGDAYDEGPLAAATAAYVGARLHTVSVTDRDLAAAFPDAVVHAESACINTHAAAKLRLHAAVRAAGYRVALTGEGADEILFGYPHLRADLRGTVGQLAESNGASAGLMLPDGSGIPLTQVRRTLGFVPTWLAAKASFGYRVRRLLSPEWRHDFDHRDPGATLLTDFDPARFEGLGRVEQSAYLWTKLALEGYILRALGDGLEMANGVEGRLPFLDGALVDHARRLPTAAKIHDGVEKWILREAMRDRLPTAVIEREKHPFLGPPMGPQMVALVRDILGDPSLRGLGVFDSARLAVLVDRLATMDPAERKAFDPVLLFVASIGILHTRMGMAI
ncbi:asparagine synthase (glutamine-hydrolyzing) [Nocardia sp. NPDC051750]|uniref:asparagine synthase (glutamine-hydrolyzing) n=1 Tax=Nocardia sp. NPDC051750 TaxID=3364325 RepID=UPI0037967061